MPTPKSAKSVYFHEWYFNAGHYHAEGGGGGGGLGMLYPNSLQGSAGGGGPKVSDLRLSAIEAPSP